jgi:NhaP-type Na+/H+ or K+/H+ antiporter
MRVGACIGLILAYPMAVTVPHLLINLIISTIYGALIGTLLGSFVGALYYWMKPRSREESSAVGLEPPSSNSSTEFLGH